jgi:hypothetical protein
MCIKSQTAATQCKKLHSGGDSNPRSSVPNSELLTTAWLRQAPGTKVSTRECLRAMFQLLSIKKFDWALILTGPRCQSFFCHSCADQPSLDELNSAMVSLLFVAKVSENKFF